jgi:lipid-A-disaccharide synthase
MHTARRVARIGIVAGEPSGDLLGAMLVAALRNLVPDVELCGIAGPRMQAVGVVALYPMEKLAVRGYVEVARHFLEILAIRRDLRRRFEANPPDLFIGVDAPDFNLDLELALRTRGVTTVHFVSPSVWAWRYERLRKIRKAVSHMLALFPFEKQLYEKEGVPVTYVGHPLADALSFDPDKTGLREQLRIPVPGPVVALLPGSRISELEQMAEVFLRTAALIAEKLLGVTFLVPAVTRQARDLIEQTRRRLQLEALRIKILFGHAHAAMGAADVALVASGTATLEAALIGRPMVITYRMPALSWHLMKRHRRLPYVGLPNILSGEFIVPELLQDAATPENLAQALLNLMADSEVQTRLRDRFLALHAQLRRDAANTAARTIQGLIPHK